MNALKVEPGQVWERNPRREGKRPLYLVVSEPFDNIVWEYEDAEPGYCVTQWAHNYPQVELLNLETGEVQRTNVASLLEGNWLLLEAAPA